MVKLKGEWANLAVSISSPWIAPKSIIDYAIVPNKAKVSRSHTKVFKGDFCFQAKHICYVISRKEKVKAG